ncbi:integrin beta-like protein A, partial [Saccostrea cucullata]|uniref:integrin beta-like protein A n=1 Tax=Saccostrea cuccullata TaxID=36930 RepID=UPI002ED177B6
MQATAFIFLLLMPIVICSEFKGGTISWRPTSSPQQIEISYRMAWSRSNIGASCDGSKISSQGLITVDGNLYCRMGCDKQISSMHGKCIAYSSSEDWSLGEGSFMFTLPTPGISYVFRMEQCCWQTLTTGASSKDIRMTMTANTAPRADTGVLNSSPVVTMAPIIRLLNNCPHTFRIPVLDPDGDIVRCRFPNKNNTDECGYLCNGLLETAIDKLKDTCMFSYNPTKTGTFGVHVQIEDFSTRPAAAVLSSVPLQFLIEVFDDDPLTCTDAPVFVAPTPIDGSCYSVSNTFTKVLVARTASASQTITKISTIGPVGTTKTSLSRYGSSGREWSITVTWTPTQSQSGLHQLCFSAEVNNKLTSSMNCVELLKGTPPAVKLVKGCLTPFGKTWDKLTTTLKMCFNRKFVRPKTDKFLTIHHVNGTVARRLNLADPAVASFPDLDGREVTITLEGSPESSILPAGEYYVLVESGAVSAGSLSCTTDWSGIAQPFFWNFTVDGYQTYLSFTFYFCLFFGLDGSVHWETAAGSVPFDPDFNPDFDPGFFDVEPPTLTFTSNPLETKGNASITWSVSEPLAVSSCAITYPNKTESDEPCFGQWEALDLPPGPYQISITLVDLAGLQGGPFLLIWTNIDVTPPTLTFRRKPRRSLSKANITWVTSEVATGVCEIS